MKWSKYNILSKSDKYGHLLFNTMSMVFLQINEEDLQAWLELKSNPDKVAEISN